MASPGFKVLHMPDVDFRSSCLTLVACLSLIKDWSDAHPDHAPILIMLNAKTGAASLPGGAAPLAFDAAAWDALDAEIRQVFAADRLITPDQVRGDHATLREGVLAGGWPALARRAARSSLLWTKARRRSRPMRRGDRRCRAGPCSSTPTKTAPQPPI